MLNSRRGAASPPARRPRGRPPLVFDEDELFDATILTLAELGDTASLQDIADRAGVAKTTLHDRYGGKAALVGKATERERRRLADHLVASYESARHDSRPGAQIRLGYAALFGYARTRPAAFHVLFGPGSRPAPSHAEARAAVSDTIAALVSERFRAAGLPVDSSGDIIAAVIVGAGESVARIVADDATVDPDAVTTLVARIMTDGLASLGTAAAELAEVRGKPRRRTPGG